MTVDKRYEPPKWRRNTGLLLIPAGIGALAVYLLWQTNPDIDYWRGLFQSSIGYLENNPWALLAALATLPGLGFPISPLLVLFGIALAPRYGMPATCLLGILAQSVCTIWSYLLAAGPLRGILSRYLRRRRELPQFTDRNIVRVGLILRITPGIPYALQNVALGILGMRLKPYLAVSIPITSLWSIGFIVTGGALFEGRAGLAITGILLLLVLILITRTLRRRTQPDVG